MNRKQVSWKVDLACGMSTLLLLSGVIQCSGIETNIVDFAKEKEKALKGDAEAQIVTLRCFAGLNREETAAVLGISVPTIDREWRFIVARLHKELSDSGSLS